LEACCDSVANCISYPLAYLLESILPAYKRRGTEPLRKNVRESFVEICNRYNIPVLFISSKADYMVPYKNVVNLCNLLYKAGLQDFYLTTLKSSGHDSYLFNNRKDRALAHFTTHAFYKHCSVNYIPHLADLGEAFLKQYEPINI